MKWTVIIMETLLSKFIHILNPNIFKPSFLKKSDYESVYTVKYSLR
jgi:hypothetical protein